MLAYFTLQFFRVAEMTYFHTLLLWFRERQTMNCPYSGECVRHDDLLVTRDGAPETYQSVFQISRNSLLDFVGRQLVAVM